MRRQDTGRFAPDANRSATVGQKGDESPNPSGNCANKRRRDRGRCQTPRRIQRELRLSDRHRRRGCCRRRNRAVLVVDRIHDDTQRNTADDAPGDVIAALIGKGRGCSGHHCGNCQARGGVVDGMGTQLASPIAPAKSGRRLDFGRLDQGRSRGQCQRSGK